MTSRSMAFRLMAFTCLTQVPSCRFAAATSATARHLPLSHRIGFLQLREIALLLELSDDAELEIVVRRCGARRRCRSLSSCSITFLAPSSVGAASRGIRRLKSASVAAITLGSLVLNFCAITCLALALVGEREIGAGDIGLHEARERVAILPEIAVGDHDGIENPRRLGGGEVDDRD